MIVTRDLDGIPQLDLKTPGVIIQYIDNKHVIEHHLHRFAWKGEVAQCEHVRMDGSRCGTVIREGVTISSWIAWVIDLEKTPLQQPHASSSVPPTSFGSSKSSDE
jgi:hypothetical protein